MCVASPACLTTGHRNATSSPRHTCHTAPNGVQVTILSKHFWPNLHDDGYALHPVVKERVATFGRAYASVKQPRKLEFVSQRGLVTMDVELDDGGVRSFEVPPMVATIMLHFQDQGALLGGWRQRRPTDALPRRRWLGLGLPAVQKRVRHALVASRLTRAADACGGGGRMVWALTGTWTVAELAEVMAVTPQKLQRRLAFWVREGMVRATGGSGDDTSYTVMKSLEEAYEHGDGGDGGDAGDDEAAAAADEDGMHVYEKYILGMLTNFDSLPLDRIHNMLKMFVSDDTPCTWDVHTCRGRCCTPSRHTRARACVTHTSPRPTMDSVLSSAPLQWPRVRGPCVAVVAPCVAPVLSPQTTRHPRSWVASWASWCGVMC